MNSDIDNWVAPLDLKNMDFGANCEVWGAWLSATMTPDTWLAEQGIALGANFPRSVALIRSALPDGWPMPTYSQAANWWATIYMPEFPVALCDFSTPPPAGSDCRVYYDTQLALNDNVNIKPSVKCPEALCRAMARTADPDLAGIGILVSYLFEAILVTIFLLAYIIDGLKRRRWHRRESMTRESSTELPNAISRPSPPADGLDRLIDNFRHCVKPFFDSAAFFSISMLVAAIYSAKKSMDERKQIRETRAYILMLPGFYDIKLALLTTLFSVFPLCILALIGDQDQRRRQQRHALILITYALCIALVFISPKAEWDSGQEGLEQIECDNRGGQTYWQGLRALRYMSLILPVGWAMFWVIVRNPLRITGLERSQFILRIRPWFVIASTFLALVGMWTLLGSFIALRSTIIKAAGDSDQSNNLAFGQVLALFVWAPVAVAFGYVAFFGPKITYEGEMTIDYDVKLAASELDVRGSFQLAGAQTYYPMYGVK
ncbi:hypothetical protein F5X68DRAFT_250098 [Plectosphaerella plurivora]|uniref:Uncharacterized protein n=1 Tax=Plectosphaerella plurivora TaxID=936078 RepID=A0A9P9A595_9PEZI|nr:hypothetical protein F5X68DRAFT_250098 [Plectosphaerella plurivora]